VDCAFRRTKKLEDLVADAKLSDRERTVLLLAADGLTDKEIANSLGLSLKTVHTYWDRMRGKLGASTRTQILAKFLRIDISPDGDPRGFRRLFATWEEGVWVLKKNGRSIYVNARIPEMFGLTSDDFAKNTAEWIFKSVHGEAIWEFVNGSHATARTLEHPIQHPTRGKIWLRLVCTPFAEDGHDVHECVLLISDLTVQKRVEHALNACESILNRLTEVSSDCIAKFDSKMVCTYANPTLLRTLHAPAEALENKTIHQLGTYFQPVEQWAEALQKAIQTGEPQQFSHTALKDATEMTSWLFPEPGAEFSPASILTVTRCVQLG